jgi:hypothetical protein
VDELAWHGPDADFADYVEKLEDTRLLKRAAKAYRAM